MNKEIKFEILGKPKGKARPRFRKIGKFVSTYNPKETTDYEKLVKISALEQCKNKLDKDYEGQIRIEIQAIFKPNKSISKKKYNELINAPYLHKPDFDNIAKIICDSLNGVAYKDDNQIYSAIIEKKYGEEDMVKVILNYED